MALPLYLAMTEGEIANCPLPAKLAYMACHFSPYGKGLSDLPQELPEGSLLILDDRVPIWNHDPGAVAAQLHECVEKFKCSGCLLDFQRPGVPLITDITRSITDILPCPVAVTEPYAEGVGCSVLISAPMPNQPLSSKAEHWKGRELWLEVAVETVRYTITEISSSWESIDKHSEAFTHRDDRLCCSYRVDVQPDKALFTIGRTWEDLQTLIAQAEEIGFARAVGLYQQLRQWCL